jgi:hypothetical protein
MTVGEMQPATVFREDWTLGIDSKWRPFGVPRPSVDTSADGVPATSNGGEGSFTSGLYSVRKYPTGRGLIVDSWISVRITLDHWQVAMLSLEDAYDDDGLRRWNHNGGTPPRKGMVINQCGVGYAVSEGASFGDSVGVTPGSLGGSSNYGAPAAFRSGAWFHVRLQIFPDGRCGVAINGVPASVTRYRDIPDTAVRLVINGNTSRTQALVGPTTMRTGVATDIDWSRLGRPIPDKPPPGWSPKPQRVAP